MASQQIRFLRNYLTFQVHNVWSMVMTCWTTTSQLQRVSLSIESQTTCGWIDRLFQIWGSQHSTRHSILGEDFYSIIFQNDVVDPMQKRLLATSESFTITFRKLRFARCHQNTTNRRTTQTSYSTPSIKRLVLIWILPFPYPLQAQTRITEKER